MKPRRDITLGEMQDECRFRGDNCETVGGDRCKFFEVCATMQTIDKGCLTPIMWNLTDRLESQEQTIAALTARAEKAEKNRDIWEKKWWEEALKKVEAQWERDTAVAEKERILNLRASENTDNKYLYML